MALLSRRGVRRYENFLSGKEGGGQRQGSQVDKDLAVDDLLFEFLTHSFLGLLIEDGKGWFDGLSVCVGVASKKSQWVKKNALTQWKARFVLPEKNQIIC